MSDTEKETEFRSYIAALDEQGRADAYTKIMSIPAQEQIDATVEQTLGSMTRTDMEAQMIAALTEQMGMSEENISDYIAAMSDDEISGLFEEMVAEQFKAQYAAQVEQQLAAMTPAQLAGALDMAVQGYTAEQCAVYYDEILEFSESSYDSN